MSSSVHTLQIVETRMSLRGQKQWQHLAHKRRHGSYSVIWEEWTTPATQLRRVQLELSVCKLRPKSQYGQPRTGWQLSGFLVEAARVVNWALCLGPGCNLVKLWTEWWSSWHYMWGAPSCISQSLSRDMEHVLSALPGEEGGLTSRWERAMGGPEH